MKLGSPVNDARIRRTFYILSLLMIVLLLIYAIFIQVYYKQVEALELEPIRVLGSMTFGSCLRQGCNNCQTNENESKIASIFEEQREIIRMAFANYTFPAKDNVTSLQQLIPEEGGRPITTFIISTWRSGSSFLGQIFNAHPGSYFVYEPYQMYRARQINAPPHSEYAIQILRKLLESDYSDPVLNRFMFVEKKRRRFMKQNNKRFYEGCEKHDLCFDPAFRSGFQKLFPILTLKMTRLRLHLITSFFENPQYNIRIILLVRDPRAVMASRRHFKWCSENVDCIKPINLCADLISDYGAALRFLDAYPNRLKIVRYEDLSKDPFGKTKELFEFAGLKFHPAVKQFLIAHTLFNSGDAFSTYRKSDSMIFRWKTRSSADANMAVQEICSEALQLWGYQLISNFSDSSENSIDWDFQLPS